MQIRIIHLPYRRLSVVNFTENDRHTLIGEIQKLLTEQGLYHSAPHGFYDANTIEAVNRFQEANGLSATGELTPITYCRLHKAAVTQIPTISKPKKPQTVQRANLLITKSTRQLTLFNGNTPLRQYPIAIGKPSTPTPEGNYSIATKIINPGGVLGSRWLGLNYDAYGIHGTNAP